MRRQEKHILGEGLQATWMHLGGLFMGPASKLPGVRHFGHLLDSGGFKLGCEEPPQDPRPSYRLLGRGRKHAGGPAAGVDSTMPGAGPAARAEGVPGQAPAAASCSCPLLRPCFSAAKSSCQQAWTPEARLSVHEGVGGVGWLAGRKRRTQAEDQTQKPGGAQEEVWGRKGRQGLRGPRTDPVGGQRGDGQPDWSGVY